MGRGSGWLVRRLYLKNNNKWDFERRISENKEKVSTIKQYHLVVFAVLPIEVKIAVN